MITVTLPLSEEVAARIEPLTQWLSPILELGLVGFRTPATIMAAEVVEFLASNPSPAELLQYHSSKRAQNRLRRLLALHNEGLLSVEEEQQELDELQQIERIIRRCKITGVREQQAA